MTEPVGSPSWAAAGPADRAGSGGGLGRGPRPRPSEPIPVTLALAAALTVVLAVVEIVHIVGRSELVPALRGFLVLIVALQFVLAWGLLRRSSGAALGVYLCQATTFVAALAGGLGSGVMQPLLAAGAVAVIALLSVSLRAFPPPQLPALPSGRTG